MLVPTLPPIIYRRHGRYYACQMNYFGCQACVPFLYQLP